MLLQFLEWVMMQPLLIISGNKLLLQPICWWKEFILTCRIRRLKHLGYKSVIVNLSDIYAMNAIPTQIILGLGISNRFSVEALDEFYEGVYAACEKYGVDLVGGDTTSSKKDLLFR